MTHVHTVGVTSETAMKYVRDVLGGKADHSVASSLPVRVQAQIVAALAMFHGKNYIDAEGWLRKGVVPTVRSLLDITESRARSVASALAKAGLTQGNGKKGSRRQTKVILTDELSAVIDEVRSAKAAANAGLTMRRPARATMPSIAELRHPKGRNSTVSTVPPGFFETPPITDVPIRGLSAPHGVSQMLVHTLADQVVVYTQGERDLVAGVILELAERFGFRV